MKAHIFVDEGLGLNEEQKEMLSDYESYVTFSVPLVFEFERLVELDNNLVKEGMDYIFSCSNIKFINFLMLRLAKESGRQNTVARFINLPTTPIEVYSFVHDEKNDKWLLIR